MFAWEEKNIGTDKNVNVRKDKNEFQESNLVREIQTETWYEWQVSVTDGGTFKRRRRLCGSVDAAIGRKAVRSGGGMRKVG